MKQRFLCHREEPDYLNPKYDADLKQGDRVETVLIYNPATNFDDDMMYRADTLIK